MSPRRPTPASIADGRRRLRRLTFVVRGLVIVVVAGIVIFAAVSGTPRSGHAELTASSNDPSFTMSNSKDGATIFTASNTKPGDSTAGSVTIGNTGSRAGSFFLSRSNLSGSLLANQLDLTIDNSGTPIYSGKLGAMGTIALGTFQPGESHTYNFTATLPSSSDNTFENASMSVEYDWSATAPNPPASGGAAGGGGFGGSGGVGTPPSITSLLVSSHTFYIGTGLPRISIATGTTISFRLSERARVTFAFLQYASGRKLGSRCVLHRTTGRRCTITYTRGTLVVNGKAGLNKLRFFGRLSRTKTLRPGRYTLAVSAKDANGNVSRTLKTTLTLLRRR
jgi:spore coat-associated protein N